ncbi:MAG: SRPBCC family protein, partial [Verrucomicrobiota bacterium]
GPTVTNTFEGPKGGKGATMFWSSEGGSKGRIVIQESEAPHLVEYRTYFDDGFPSSTSRFRFTPEGNGETKISWDFFGKVPFDPRKRNESFAAVSGAEAKHQKGLETIKAVVEERSKKLTL